MDPKELKALLKEAKEGIKSKDFLLTAKNCKTILKKEPNHYQANLYLGTSMKEQGKWQQAIESYKKATEVDPLQVYAWQGIILVYEKQGIKSNNDLLDAYKRVATFFEKDDKQKYIESTKKLAFALISQDDPKSALKVITRLSKSVGVDVEMAGVIVQLLSNTTWQTRTPDQNVLYTSALETIVTQSPQPPEQTCKKYFTQLNKAEEYNKVVEETLAMKDRWNAYYSPMEWLCRYYIEERIDEKSLLEIGPMDVLTERLFKLYPSSSFGHFARGKFLVDGELRINEGFGFLSTGLESNYNHFALLILVAGRLKFGDFEGTLEDCQTGLRNFDKDPVLSKKLKLSALEALIWLDVEKAKESLEKLKQEFQNEDSNIKSQLLLLEAQLYLRKLDFESLQKVVEEMDKENVLDWKADFYKALVSVDFKDPEKISSVIDTQIELDPENLKLLLSAAIILFDLKLFEKSGEILLKKITEKPKGAALPLPWKYLGLLYSQEGNVQLAAKCFRKSYDLCPSTEVGALLSDAYFEIGEDIKNQDLLIEATKIFSKSMSKWAWLRLGILHLNSGEANEAVNAFQAAVRSDINDCHLWESLADAYCMRGSYTAALSTYNKALSLGADPMYPKLKIGVVYQHLTQYNDSISTLKSLLQEYPNHTPVLVELARTYSLVAQEMSGENYDVGALQAIEDALVYAVLAIKHSPNRVLLPWKIIGDAPLILANVPEIIKIKVPDFLLGEPQKEDGMQFKEVDFDRFKEIGTRALLECLQVIHSEESKGDYSKAITAYIYHQLALSYFNRAQTPTGLAKYPEFFQKALVCVKKAVAANSSNHMYWNTLGVVAFFCGGSDELAQHGFIKSLNLEMNNVVAWCNLGFLYLKHKNDQLAHMAFAKAQSVAPLYALSWIGQAIVAETLAPKEAPDLYRHAAHLEPNPFAVSCYADWVCRILLKDIFEAEDYWYTIVRVDALTIVNDLITRVEHRMKSPHLFNMKGIAAAFNGFYQTALESFTTALELCSVPESQFPVSEAEKTMIIYNRISILVKMGRNEEAKENISGLEQLDHVGFRNAALALAKLDDMENAENLYLQLDGQLESESDKCDLKIALAMIASKTNRLDVAYNFLNDRSTLEKPQALLALAAMGVVHFNPALVSETMQPLEKLMENNSQKFVADVGFIKACYQVMQGSPRAGINELLKLLRMYPSNGRLWSLASQMLYRYQINVIPATGLRNVTLKALRLSSSKGNPTEEISITSKSSAMISLSYLVGNDWKTAIPTALKGIRNYPEVRENWVVLACGLWHQFAEEKSKELYEKIVRLLEKELLLNLVSLKAQEWIQQFLVCIQPYKIIAV